MPLRPPPLSRELYRYLVSGSATLRPTFNVYRDTVYDLSVSSAIVTDVVENAITPSLTGYYSKLNEKKKKKKSMDFFIFVTYGKLVKSNYFSVGRTGVARENVALTVEIVFDLFEPLVISSHTIFFHREIRKTNLLEENNDIEPTTY